MRSSMLGAPAIPAFKSAKHVVEEGAAANGAVPAPRMEPQRTRSGRPESGRRNDPRRVHRGEHLVAPRPGVARVPRWVVVARGLRQAGKERGLGKREIARAPR